MDENYNSAVATIARMKPLHQGTANMYSFLCKNYAHVLIGVGGSNKPLSFYSPFSAKESAKMLELHLTKEGHKNYSVIMVPDFVGLNSKELARLYLENEQHKDYPIFQRDLYEVLTTQKEDAIWKENFKLLLEKHCPNEISIDTFVTHNEWVIDIFKDEYNIKKPLEFLPKEYQVASKGSLVRYKMVTNDNWQHLVPNIVADYITTNGLDTRLKNLYGDRIIEKYTLESALVMDNLDDEIQKAMLGQ